MDAPIPTILYPETRIFWSDGIELTPDLIQPELKAAVDGVAESLMLATDTGGQKSMRTLASTLPIFSS